MFQLFLNSRGMAVKMVNECRLATMRAATLGKLVPTESALAAKEGREYERGSTLLNRILLERQQKWEAARSGIRMKEK